MNSYIDKSLKFLHPPLDIESSSFAVEKSKFINEEGLVYPNSLFRREIDDGIHLLFHDRDKRYGLVEPNSKITDTPFYLLEKERVLLLLGKLGQLESSIEQVTQEPNDLLKQEIMDGVKNNTDLTQARRIADQLIDLTQVSIIPPMVSGLRYNKKKK
jgi:hypothetical protein